MCLMLGHRFQAAGQMYSDADYATLFLQLF
jgi:hypothetical protein